MKLPKDIIPQPYGGKTENFELYSVREVQVALRGGTFTLANGCIVLDFFVRHRIITFENERDFIKIVSTSLLPRASYSLTLRCRYIAIERVLSIHLQVSRRALLNPVGQLLNLVAHKSTRISTTT